MSEPLRTFIAADLFPLLTATLAALACALLGNFLVLRKQSMMGDAISHAVLPGIVGGFILFHSIGPWAMFLGATAAGLVNVVLVELIRKLGRVEPGASMGVAFTTLFALGVVMLEQTGGRQIHLDPDCVLYGQLEASAWYDALNAESPAQLLSWEMLRTIPRQAPILAATLAAGAIFVGILFKELRLAAFDPGFASSIGFRPTLLHYLLMLFVAAAVVASFEAVGSILVIAMLICPPATARLLTERLPAQIAASLALALFTGVAGYVLAVWGPGWIALRTDAGAAITLNVAGAMSVLAGLLLAAAIALSPSHGLIPRLLRQRRLAGEVAREDILAMLYRLEEIAAGDDAPSTPDITPPRARAAVGGGITARLALRRALRSGDVARAPSGALALTDGGRARARQVIRSHRLWELYLVEDLGLRADHVHRRAAQLEHLRAPTSSGRLLPDRFEAPGAAPSTDPHDRPIPD